MCKFILVLLLTYYSSIQTAENLLLLHPCIYICIQIKTQFERVEKLQFLGRVQFSVKLPIKYSNRYNNQVFLLC